MSANYKPMPIQVLCPNCQQTVLWAKESVFKPFCSERCKMIDLGDWASEKHAIAGEDVQYVDQEDYLEH